MNKDQKGDLVEKLIFEAYKDKYIKSSKWFKEEILKNYKYTVSTETYKKILNYQIKKYGRTIQDAASTDFINYFNLKKSQARENHKEIMDRRYKAEKALERMEKHEIKRIKERTI